MRYRDLFLLGALLALAGCGSDSPETSTVSAQWVFQLGGTLRVAGKVKDAAAPAELPPPPYQIERISLNGTKVKDEDLQKLVGLKSLRSLSLYRTEITDAALIHVVAIPNLEELELSYTRVSDQGLPRLLGMPRLTKLYLYGTNATVTENGLKTLQVGKPHLKVFR